MRDGDAALGADGEVNVRGAAPGLGDQLEAGQPREQVAGDARPFADQYQRVGRFQPRGEGVEIGHRVVVNGDGVPGQFGETVEGANGVLVVVGDDDVHN